MPVSKHLNENPARSAAAAIRLNGAGQGRGWLPAARSEAETRSEAAGLPARRDEYWKFTDPGVMLGRRRQISELLYSVPALLDGAAAVLCDHGKFQLPDEEQLESQGVTVQTLPDAAQSGSSAASEIYGMLEAAAHETAPRGLAAVNTSRAGSGLVIECRPDCRAAVQLLNDPALGESDSIIHHVIDVRPGAELRFSESGTAAARTNIVYEIRIGEGASIEFTRVPGAGNSGSMCSVFADVAEGGRFNLFGLSAWSPWIRNECVVRLLGDHAKASLSGAVLGGKGCHHDDTILVVHEGEHCESRQVYKKVLRHGAKGVFQGKILVRPGAQKTDGYQISQGLLLDDDSQFLAKPELEIYADDVVCSHGSTSGGVDETAMFYLRSRGIGEAEAQELLALAFLSDAISEVGDEQLRARLNCLASEWFAGDQ